LHTSWCEHCVQARPEFSKAASLFKDDPKVAFVAMDCMKYAEICKSYDVSSYPSVRYVSYLKAVYDYTLPRKASSFVQFMRNPEVEITGEKARIVPFTSDKLVSLTDETFEATIKKFQSAMVLFFVEYCDHSKKLKPIYSNCANILHTKKSPHTLVAVNCARAFAICHKYDVKSYPAMKYFRRGKFVKDYGMERSSAHIMAFLNANNKDEL
jgi:thioredoxin-like negative regulator of GroEL